MKRSDNSMKSSVLLLLLVVTGLFLVPGVFADDLEFAQTPMASGDSETTFAGGLGFFQYFKEQQNVDGGQGTVTTVGGVGKAGTDAGINITPERSRIIINPGATATTTIRVYNYAKSQEQVYLDTRLVSSAIEDKILFDGNQPRVGYSVSAQEGRNYVDVQITVLTDFTAGAEETVTYTAEIFAESVVGSDIHPLQIVVETDRTNLFTGLATTPLFSISEREDRCVTNAEGEVVCRSPITAGIAGFTFVLWHGVLLAILLCLLFFAWWRRREPAQETKVYVDSDGFYTHEEDAKSGITRRPYSLTGDEEFEVVDSDEDDMRYTEGGGFRFR